MLEKSFKVDKTCRACTKSDQKLVSLFDKTNVSDGVCYSDMITECTMYTILEDDALPQRICFECTDKVRIAYEFKKQFEESQKKLLALVVESMKEITVEPIETVFYNCNDQLGEVSDANEYISTRRKSIRNSSSRRNDINDHIALNNQNNTSDEKPRRNKCPICSKEFVRMGHLKNHLNKFHKEVDTSEKEAIEKVIVKCESTEFVVATIRQPVNSLKPESDVDDNNFDFGTNNDEDTINCPETGSIKSFKAELDTSDKETTTAERINPNKNDHIDKEENTKKTKKKKIIHQERRFKCETCNKTFKRNSHLKQHLLCHTKLKPYECAICYKKFSRTDNLKVHMTNHGKKQFECDCCHRSFGQAYLLKRHKEQTHSEEKPFLCSECGQRFVRKGDLAVHMRRHTGEKPYKCQYCNKGFTRSTEVYVHERYHTGEKKHVCNICGKAFQRPYNLVVHVRTHTGERPYQCPHCPKNFAQCSDLKAHIRRHTGERYKCDQCSMGFIHVFVLNQHKRTAHGIDVPSRIIRIAKLNKEVSNAPFVNEISRE